MQPCIQESRNSGIKASMHPCTSDAIHTRSTILLIAAQKGAPALRRPELPLLIKSSGACYMRNLLGWLRLGRLKIA